MIMTPAVRNAGGAITKRDSVISYIKDHGEPVSLRDAAKECDCSREYVRQICDDLDVSIKSHKVKRKICPYCKKKVMSVNWKETPPRPAEYHRDCRLESIQRDGSASKKEFTCMVCGNTFERFSSLVKDASRVTCSKPCRLEALSKHLYTKGKDRSK